MNTSLKAKTIRRWRSRSTVLLICAVLAAFIAGMLLTQYVMSRAPAIASGDRVFELMVYHTLPGKAPALESVFRESFRLRAKHGIDMVGYWVPNEDPAWMNTVVCLVAHPSRKAAEAHWNALHADPQFLPFRQRAIPLIEHANDDYRVDEVYMRPTDFSPMK